MRHRTTFVFLLCLLIGGIASAQEEHQRLFQINTNGEHIKAEAFVKPQRIKTKNNLFYYWIKAREIHFSQGGYEGNVLHGSYVCFYPNEQLKEQGKFYKGLKDGEWKKWHNNGRLEEITYWNKGRQVGEMTRYSSDGKIKYRAYYKNNLLHGKEHSYKNDSIADVKIYKKGTEKVFQPKPEKKKKFRKSAIQPLEEKEGNPLPEEKKQERKKSTKKPNSESRS